MKISEVQARVLYLMNNDWELGYRDGFYTSAWLQKGGCCYGGKTQDIRINTFFALLNKKLIEENKKGFPITTYKLTEKGKGILKEVKKCLYLKR